LASQKTKARRKPILLTKSLQTFGCAPNTGVKYAFNYEVCITDRVKNRDFAARRLKEKEWGVGAPGG